MSPEELNEMVFNNFNEECECPKGECSKINYQYANVSVPVQLKPKTIAGDIIVECCEEPHIECNDNQCENQSEITITQKVRIKIPIRYKIDACVGESVISCE